MQKQPKEAGIIIYTVRPLNPNYSTNGFYFQTVAFPLATFAENLLILAEADTRVNGFAAGLTRLNAFRTYMSTGGYIGSTYLTAGNYKYDAYVAADFAAAGIENGALHPLPTTGHCYGKLWRNGTLLSLDK